MIATSYKRSTNPRLYVLSSTRGWTTHTWDADNGEWEDTSDTFKQIYLASPEFEFIPDFNPRRSLSWLRNVPKRDRFRRQTGNHAQWKRRHEMWGGR